MQAIIQILLLVFLPVQLSPLSLAAQKNDFTGPQVQTSLWLKDHPSSQNEAVSAKTQSMRGSISDSVGQNEIFQNSSFFPERIKGFKPTKVFAGSSVVLDVDSGTIMHYDNGREHMAIASLTKMMTAVIVMEKVKNLDEPVTIDQEALKTDGTKVGCPTSVLCNDERLHNGERVTVKDLLTAMLLDSANDAAIALGKHIAGSQEAFAGLMNEKARELNFSDTHFCNPSGLDIDGCYSSAYDLARIAAYSMRYDTIWKIMRLQESQIGSCDGKYVHNLKNTDMLLGEIPNCLGGKTGFTYNAGKSLMLAASDPGSGKHRIIAVILNDNARWQDMRDLLDWTFASYSWK